MKLKIQKAVVLTGLMAFSAMAQQPTLGTLPSGGPDKEKVSYALGMNMGLDLKNNRVGVDTDMIAQALQDVLEGRPTQLKESEIGPLFNQAQVTGLAKQAESDLHKVSYALGMRMAMQLKSSGPEVDGKVIAQAIKDVLEGKPTKIQESEIQPLFTQAQAYGLAQQAKKNKSAGEPFLAKNAKAPGITVLPDGLQYRVLQAGAGPIPTTNDLLFIKYRGSLLDGKEFARHNHFLTRPTGGPKGWQDALQRMKVGARWQIFVPPALGFGAEGDPIQKVGPEATLIYELELLSIAQPGDPGIGTGSLGHGLDNEVSPPNPDK